MRQEGYPPPPRDPRADAETPYDVEKGDLAGLQDGAGDGQSDKTTDGSAHLEPMNEAAMLSAYPDGGLKAWSVVFGTQYCSEYSDLVLTFQVDFARCFADLVSLAVSEDSRPYIERISSNRTPSMFPLDVAEKSF